MSDDVPELPPDRPDPPAGVMVRYDEPLAKHLPTRVGGPCEAYVVVQDRDAVPDAITWCRMANLKRTWLGAGTRTVARDGGLAGAVLRLGRPFVGVVDDGDGIWVGGATPLAWVAAAIPGLSALRFHGGTVGASVALDDGWGGWVDRVRHVGRGREQEDAFGDLDAASRAGRIVTEVRFRREGEGRPHVPDPACWWDTSGDDDPVDLLRDTTLAGTRLRGVALPRYAPGMIVNLGGGDARDVALLLRSVTDRVHTLRGVKLQDRMAWWGRA